MPGRPEGVPDGQEDADGHEHGRLAGALGAEDAEGVVLAVVEVEAELLGNVLAGGRLVLLDAEKTV